MAEQKPRKKVKLYPIMSDEKALALAQEMTRDWKFPDPPIGTLVKKQAIYLGKYNPIDRDGNSLGKIFNAYAAPEDLPGTMKYLDTVNYITTLKNWHGHDGTNYATDKELYEALKDNSYNGGWIIPTRDLLSGLDVDGNKTQENHLYKHQNTGAFKDTFKTAASSGSYYPAWYWSSTEDRDDPSTVRIVRPSDSLENWFLKDCGHLSCRPVRLVPAASPQLNK